MRIIRSTEHRIIPWRNGQGVTREVAQAPAADGSGFDWRVSIATVDRSGPFSAFPGIDRTIALLSGDGFTLRFAEEQAGISPGAPPYAFAGERSAEALVPAGPSTDLNVMTRRGAFSHTVRSLPTAPVRIAAPMSAIVLVLSNGDLRVTSKEEELRLGPLDSVLIDGSDAEISVTPAHNANAFVIAIDPARL